MEPTENDSKAAGASNALNGGLGWQLTAIMLPIGFVTVLWNDGTVGINQGAKNLNWDNIIAWYA